MLGLSCGTWDLCWGMPTLSCGMWDQFLDQELNLHSLHWECRVLATAPPGKSLKTILKCVQRFIHKILITEESIALYIRATSDSQKLLHSGTT